jgi:SAM-dependent methyltransferase
MTLWTEDPRSVATYDAECVGRLDHDLYLALAAEWAASDVVDLGCGTGVLAVELARAGCSVVGVDPAAAMIDAARRRPGGDLVTWMQGTAADLPAAGADLIVMTGHVAQYFVDEQHWASTLRDIHRALRPAGRVAFESRVPERDWRHRWSPERTRATHPHPDGGTFTSWVQVMSWTGDESSFRMTHRGHTVLPDGTRLSHDETLRFRNEGELRASLVSAGFEVESLWGDWGRGPVVPTSDELIFVAGARF